MADPDIYTVEIWGKLPDGRVFTPSFQTQSDGHAAALALRDLRLLGHAVDDGVKLHVRLMDVASDPGTDFSARDVRWWLRNTEQADFVTGNNLADLLK